MKRDKWYVLLLLCFCIPLFFGKAHAEEITGTFTYTTSGLEKEEAKRSVPYTYRDSFFSCSSYDLNMDLIAMSIRMAMAGFGEGEDSLPTNLLSMFDALSFRYDERTVHYGKAGPDTIGFAYGFRDVSEDEAVVCIVFRGGNYGDEWASNFTLGTGDNHFGFRQAATPVYAEIRGYLQSLKDKRKVSVWITGYSRGAAVANLVAADLDNAAAEGNLGPVKPENIYAFCFECPLTSKLPEPASDQTKYNNIFSFVNDVDAVTKVAPGRWGFQRYGISCFLPSAMNCKDFGSLLQKMLPIFGEYADISVYAIDYSQTVYLDRMFEKLLQLIGNASNYEKYLQDIIRKTILGESTVSNKIADLVMPYIRKHLESEKKEPSDQSLMNFGAAHAPELCMAWIDTLCEENSLIVTENEYESFVLDGKADVYVYDDKMELIAMGDGEQIHFADQDCVIGITYGIGDEFLLAYPKGSTYYVTVSAQKRDHVNIIRSLYDFRISKDVMRYEYDRLLLKKNEGAFIRLAPDIMELYVCDREQIPMVMAAWNRDGKLSQTPVPATRSFHTNGMNYPVIRAAVEVSPTPVATPTPTVSEVVESPKKDGADVSKNGWILPAIFAGIAIVLIALLTVICLLARRKKKSDLPE